MPVLGRCAACALELTVVLRHAARRRLRSGPASRFRHGHAGVFDALRCIVAAHARSAFSAMRWHRCFMRKPRRTRMRSSRTRQRRAGVLGACCAHVCCHSNSANSALFRRSQPRRGFPMRWQQEARLQPERQLGQLDGGPADVEGGDELQAAHGLRHWHVRGDAALCSRRQPHVTSKCGHTCLRYDFAELSSRRPCAPCVWTQPKLFLPSQSPFAVAS